MAKVAFFVFLILSTTAPPCDAARRRERLSLDSSEDSSIQAEETWGFSCPEGLRPNDTERVCYFDRAILDEEVYRPRPICESAFSKLGSLPIILDDPANGGTFALEEQFVDEMAAAMSNATVLDVIGEDLVELEMKKNATFAESVHEFMEQFHDLAHNHKPVEFLVTHLGLHVGLELAVHGLEVLAHAGVHAAVAGVAEGMAIAIPIVGWVLLPIMATMDAYMAYHHYKRKNHHAKNFAKRLVLKSDCVAKKVWIDKAKAESGSLLKEKVHEVCGTHAAALMAKQIQRANVKLLELMDAIAEMGRCLWPHGERSWAKVNCAEATHMPLRTAGGYPGLLYMALSVGAAYARNTDELLKTPAYNHVFTRIFGVEMSHQRGMMETLDGMENVDMTHKALGCMSMIATHRTFERTFARLAVAMKVWSRSYARDITHRDIRMLTYGKPCRRVFEKLEWSSHWQERTCKDEQFIEGKGDDEHVISEAHPCVDEEQLDFAEDFGNMLWPEDDDESHAKEGH